MYGRTQPLAQRLCAEREISIHGDNDGDANLSARLRTERTEVIVGSEPHGQDAVRRSHSSQLSHSESRVW